uniref:Corticotropin-releasing factor domain-containing protein n=1 Tax=Octopus bimaculoides TaxID=37653 RepID=A0A0L8GZR7_OCTBM
MTRHILILSIVGMVLVSLVNARYIPEEELSGKKKRSDISSDDIRRSILAQKLIQFAAERLAKTE